MLILAFRLAILFLLRLHAVFLQLSLLRALSFLLWALLGVPEVRAHKGAIQFVCPLPIPVMPRCCTRIPDEFKPSYASVLVYGLDPCKLEQAVHDAEHKQRIASCFTAWCSRCAGPYLLTTEMDQFPAPSAHHTHQLVLLSVLRESGALAPSEPV
jgi:hypothetical protein